MTGRRAAHARRLGVALAFVSLAACGGGGDSATGGAASPSASPRAAVSPTALPVNVRSHAVGRQYVEFSEQKHDRIAYSLRADAQTARRDASGLSTSEFTNPHVHFIGTDGKSLFAESPAGTVTERAKSVTVLMSGRVHAHTDDGTTLESDTLRYDDVDQTVHARGNVVLTTATDRLQGGTLDADLRLEHVHLIPGN